MVPAHFVRLDALPLNANGKLDRGALPLPSGTDRSGGRPGRAFVEPRSQTERAIAAVWADVLRLEQIGATDHFFELGGDSILSIQVVARCRRAGIVISTRDLFERPTIAELSRRASRPESIAPEMAPATFGRLVPLTPIQQWFFEHDFAAPSHWNQAFLFQVPASLDVERFRRCLDAIVQHHESLRLRFRNEGGNWLSEHASTADPIEVQRHVLSTEPPERWASLIEAHCAAGTFGSFSRICQGLGRVASPRKSRFSSWGSTRSCSLRQPATAQTLRRPDQVSRVARRLFHHRGPGRSHRAARAAVFIAASRAIA